MIKKERVDVGILLKLKKGEWILEDYYKENYFALYTAIIYPIYLTPEEAILLIYKGKITKKPKNTVPKELIATMDKLQKQGTTYDDLSKQYKMSKYKIFRLVKKYREGIL